MNIEQQEEKERKLKELLEAFRNLKTKVSGIRELSEELGDGFSRSTIQRYLHELYDRKMISSEEYLEIQEWLKINKANGQKLGGNISQELYGYSKDDHGHFQGRKK